MNSMIFSRSKIFLLFIILFLFWLAVKFLPQLKPETDIDHSLTSAKGIKPVLVSVFYEALCPDSKHFILRQLLPSVKTAARLINVSLVPYGKAKTEENADGSITFTCQHGPTECLANKIHACAISKISDTDLLVKYISCMISENRIPELVGENCAKELDIDWKPILQCSNSQEGNKLLKKFGELTDEFVPQIVFVPTILLDDKLDNQAAILKDFLKSICHKFKELPEECLNTL